MSLTFPLQRQIVFFAVLLLCLGQVMLFSATGVMGIQKYGTEFYFVVRQLAVVAVGLAAMAGISRLPSVWLYRVAYFLMGFQILLVAATWLSPAGHAALGASRWLHLGGVAFQPSEFARIAVSIYVARFLVQIEQRPFSRAKWVVWGTPLVLLLLFVLKQPDLGTTVLLVSIILGMAFVAGLHLRVFAGVGAVVISLAALLMYLAPYRRKRVFAFLDPWSDPQGNGFQTIQSFLSFHSGKMFGVGIGNGNSKLFFLPEVHTDFIFSLIGEELGFVGAVGVILAFVYFTYLLLRTSLVARDRFGQLLAVGLSLALLLPVLINIMGVTGLLPVKGLPLPFFSWGRSAMVANLTALGILLNIVRESGKMARR